MVWYLFFQDSKKQKIGCFVGTCKNMPKVLLYNIKKWLFNIEELLLWKLKLRTQSDRNSYVLNSLKQLYSNYFGKCQIFFQVAFKSRTYLIFSHQLI